MKHIKKWRITQLEEITNLISKYKVIGVGNLDSFPASLLQKLKKNLDDVVFKVTSRSVIKKSLEKLNHKDLLEKLPNQVILILTNKDAFSLYSSIKKAKAKSKAKVGMISPIDIIVQEGDTGLPPGPALSDLKKVGIKAQVRGATIFVPSNTTITKAGEEITSDVVSILSKLDIKPIELILDVPVVKEDSLLYLKDVLDIDANKIYDDIVQAVRSAINLGVEIVYTSKETIEPIILKAHLQAKALQEEVEIISTSSNNSESSENKNIQEKKE
jgi:large subunit ribosomal protein L10